MHISWIFSSQESERIKATTEIYDVTCLIINTHLQKRPVSKEMIFVPLPFLFGRKCARWFQVA